MIQLICEKIQPDAVVTTQVGGVREIPAEELAGLFHSFGTEHVSARPVLEEALKEALSLQEDGMVFCVGSLYLIGEIKKIIQKDGK